MKKMNCLGLVACLLVLVGCQEISMPNAENAGSTDALRSEAPSVAVEVPADLPEDLPVNVPYLISKGSVAWFGEYVALIDLLTGEELVTLMLEGDVDIVVDVFNFQAGYFAALVGVNNPVHLYFSGDAPDDFDLNAAMEVDHDYQLRYLILDDELNVLHELPVTSEKLNDANVHVFNTVVYQHNELMVYFSPNYLFSDTDGTVIYRYHAHTGVEERLFEFDHRISINDLELIAPSTSLLQVAVFRKIGKIKVF